MSDQRDETRKSAASGDPTRADGPRTAGETPPRRGDADPPPRLDDATTAGSRLDVDDATTAGSRPDRDDDTVAGSRPRRDDDTIADSLPGGGDGAAAGTPPGADADRTVVAGMPPVRGETGGGVQRPDATAIIPAVTDDWAPSRANPAWSGRAEVRAPLPGATSRPEADDWPVGAPQEPRDRWWMPIVVGIVGLILLAALGWGVYQIVQNSDRATPAPTTTAPSAAPAQIVEPTLTAAPSTEPTTAAATTATAAEPTAELTIPALRGLSLPDAKAALTATGLRWRVIEIDDDAPAGTVIDSDPAEGQEVPPGTRVTLVVASASASTPAAPATTAAPAGGSGVDGE